MLDIFNQMESEIIPERGESIHKAADDPFRPWFLIGPASVPWRYRFVKKEREKKKKPALTEQSEKSSYFCAKYKISNR